MISPVKFGTWMIELEYSDGRVGLQDASKQEDGFTGFLRHMR